VQWAALTCRAGVLVLQDDTVVQKCAPLKEFSVDKVAMQHLRTVGHVHVRKDAVAAAGSHMACLTEFVGFMRASRGNWFLPALRTLCQESHRIVALAEAQILRRGGGVRGEPSASGACDRSPRAVAPVTHLSVSVSLSVFVCARLCRSRLPPSCRSCSPTCKTVRRPTRRRSGRRCSSSTRCCGCT
jgi:hypothetical protein